MKNNMVRAFASALSVVSCVAMFAKMSHSELLEHRKQSVKDWQTVVTMLQKAGYTDKDSVYKRTHTALKRSQNRLAQLEKGAMTGEALRKKGRGLLEKAGLISAAKKTETTAKATRPKTEKSTGTKRKAQEKEAQRRVSKKPKKS